MARRRYYGSADNTKDDDEEQHLLDTAYCDHYSSQSPNNVNAGGSGSNCHSTQTKLDDDSAPGNNTARSRPRLRSPLVIVTMILLFTIGAVCFSYVQLQQQLTALSAQLQSNISHIDSDLALEIMHLNQMNATLANHSKVISRFANSLSNNDVLAKLQELETESKKREERVVEEMDNTKNEIRGVLTKTKMEIDETVR